MTQKNNKKVSVIIPAYNRPKKLRQAIISVVSQRYDKGSIECIVVDDGSSPPLESVCQKINSSCVTYIKHKSNQGAAEARNTGISESSGQYIAFLDDDDTWKKDKIKLQVRLIEDLPSSYGMVYCWMNYYNNEKKVKKYSPKFKGDIFSSVLDANRICNASTLLLKKDVVKEVGGFDTSIPSRADDGDFIRRVAKVSKVDFVPEHLVWYYMDPSHEQLTSSDKEGIRSAIAGQKVKLKKFKNDLNRLPRRKAYIYARIAYRYSQIRQWNKCLYFAIKALKNGPIHLPIYRQIFGILEDKYKLKMVKKI